MEDRIKRVSRREGISSEDAKRKIIRVDKERSLYYNSFGNKQWGMAEKKYYLTDMNINQCRGCFSCRRKEGCVIKDDMTTLFDDIVTSDFVIFSSPIYCFDVCGSFKLMFERLYPMLSGGMALGEGFQKYTHRYPNIKSMLILSQGAISFMCRGVKKQIQSNLKMNGFKNIGTVVIDSTYSKKKLKLTDKQVKKIQAICSKVC